MGFLDNFKINNRYGAFAMAASPVIIIGGIYVAWTYWRRKRAFSRSMSMGALRGGQLALERLIHHHKAREVKFNALADLESRLSAQQQDFKKLQVTISLIEAAGKEAEAVAILKDHLARAKREKKSHEAYEIEMLLVEMLIYQRSLEEARKCDCLTGAQIPNTDARCPFFKAIIAILSDKKSKESDDPEKYWNEFNQIRSQFQFPPVDSDDKIDEEIIDFNEFKEVVRNLF